MKKFCSLFTLSLILTANVSPVLANNLDKQSLSMQKQTDKIHTTDVFDSRRKEFDLNTLTIPKINEMKAGYSIYNMEMFCDINYIKRRHQATSMNESMSIRSEAIKNDCARRLPAGSPFLYKYVGTEEDKRILVLQNIEGKDYYHLTSPIYVVAETPQYVPKPGQHSISQLKQLLDRKSDESYYQWYSRVDKTMYKEDIAPEEYRAWKSTIPQEDIFAYGVMTIEKNRVRGEMINGIVEEMIRETFTPSSRPQGGNPNTISGCESHELGTYPNCRPNPDAY